MKAKLQVAVACYLKKLVISSTLHAMYLYFYFKLKLLQSYFNCNFTTFATELGDETCLHRNAIGFYTSGQREDTSKCANGFVWRPFENETLNMCYENWIEIEPNCADETEHCLAYYLSGQKASWYKTGCERSFCPVCQYFQEHNLPQAGIYISKLICGSKVSTQFYIFLHAH